MVLRCAVPVAGVAYRDIRRFNQTQRWAAARSGAGAASLWARRAARNGAAASGVKLRTSGGRADEGIWPEEPYYHLRKEIGMYRFDGR